MAKRVQRHVEINDLASYMWLVKKVLLEACLLICAFLSCCNSQQGQSSGGADMGHGPPRNLTTVFLLLVILGQPIEPTQTHNHTCHRPSSCLKHSGTGGLPCTRITHGFPQFPISLSESCSRTAHADRHGQGAWSTGARRQPSCRATATVMAWISPRPCPATERNMP